MALVIAVNEGSSSLKISVFEEKGMKRIFDVSIVGESLTIKTDHYHKVYPWKEGRSLKEIFRKLELGSVRSIGHRFIHGGSKYVKSVRLTPKVIQDLKKLNDLAPLHNPKCLALIRECRKIFGDKVKQVAVFDTAFHATMPDYAKEYAIPHALAKRYHVRKYGFHGISHAYLAERLPKEAKRAITLHLGSGCSASAILNGRSIDTSMGFSPSSGLVMGTRAGDVDSTLFEYLQRKTKKDIQEITYLLNFESGLLGLSGKTSDFKEIINRARHDKRCRLTLDVFCYRILQYIGAYTAALGGIDAIVFSGGIGENSPALRETIAAKLQWLGVKISLDQNREAIHLKEGDMRCISTNASQVKVYVIATYENFLIAKQSLV